MIPPDYTTVTELPGNRASAEQLSMIHTRYALVRERAAGMDVLEAGCGPGRALGYLAQAARSVTGLDYSQALVELANAQYGGRIRVVQGDAQALPFPDASFDVVVLFEALYYLAEAARFAAEARRVLRPGGTLLVCSANREWAGFNPSPLSVRYYAAAELRDLLAAHGFAVELKAGFAADERRGAAGRIVAALRRTAVGLGLVPKTMKGKALLKRLFYGRLRALGAELDETAPLRPLDPVTAFPVTGHKVVYAIATRI